MSQPETASQRILVIDDSPASVQSVCLALTPEFVCEFALSGSDALSRLATGDLPDLILLDILMPEMDGYEVLQRLKAEPRTQGIPVIVITASQEPESELGALLAGAADFIHKPLNPQVLRMRVGMHILLREREEALTALHEEIKQLALYDPLTGLPNRRLLMDRLEQRGREGFGALLFIELDDFAALSNTLSHERGDRLLQEVAARLRGCLRRGDTVARIGDDSFVLVLEDLTRPSEAAAAQAKLVADKILAVLSEPYHLAGVDHSSSLHIGVALFDRDRMSAEVLLKGADLALLQAKSAGPNALRILDLAMFDNTHAEPT